MTTDLAVYNPASTALIEYRRFGIEDTVCHCQASMSRCISKHQDNNQEEETEVPEEETEVEIQQADHQRTTTQAAASDRAHALVKRALVAEKALSAMTSERNHFQKKYAEQKHKNESMRGTPTAAVEDALKLRWDRYELLRHGATEDILAAVEQLTQEEVEARLKLVAAKTVDPLASV
jgi:hypothetical protein